MADGTNSGVLREDKLADKTKAPPDGETVCWRQQLNTQVWEARTRPEGSR